MAGEADIELLRLTGERGITPGARRDASSLCTQRCAKLVACKLSEDWSPEQIAGWKKLGSPENHTCRVSHETIYQTLFIQTRRGAEARAVVASAKGRFRPPGPGRAGPAYRPGADP
jgi:IS30 family transposase